MDANLADKRAIDLRTTFVATYVAAAQDYLALMKPRVMSLAVLTAIVGFLSAPGQVQPAIGAAALLCIALGAGAASILNMWYDADIDAMMSRTASRPIPRGRVRPDDALSFGLILAAGSVAGLALFANIAAAALLAFTIFFYVVVYTMWLKRSTPQNIVVGGAAGAFPPVIGWVAAGESVGYEALLLFLIIFFWTPPHFWALSLFRTEDYARAGIPMLPVIAGKAETQRQILLYTLILLPISALLWPLGFAGAIYGVVAIAVGVVMILLAMQLRGERTGAGRAARRLFRFSIVYLFLLFAVLLIEQELTAMPWRIAA
jgi:protoheme IX farnesyltransferase